MVEVQGEEISHAPDGRPALVVRLKRATSSHWLGVSRMADLVEQQTKTL
jgi:hypothetical protein